MDSITAQAGLSLSSLQPVQKPSAEEDFFLFSVESSSDEAPHSFAFALLYFADHSSMQVMTNSGQITLLGPGEVVYIPPRTLHSVCRQNSPEPCRSLQIKLDKLFNLLAPSHYCKPLESLLFDNQIKVIRSLGRSLMITNIYDEMVNSFDLAHISSIIEIIRLLSDGDHEILAQAQYKSLRETQFCIALNQLLQHSPAAKLDIDSLSKRFCMSKSTFSRTVKKTMGMSFHAWVLHQKILMAQNQLRNSDIRIQDLVSQLGFSSASHFSKAFRDHTGLSPKAYRELLTR